MTAKTGWAYGTRNNMKDTILKEFQRFDQIELENGEKNNIDEN